MADPLEARMLESMRGEIAERERQQGALTDQVYDYYNRLRNQSAFPQYGGYPQYGGGYGGGGYRGGGGGYVTPAQLAREAHRRQMSDEQWARRKEYERQLDEQEKQAQAQELEKKMADLQDPNSQLHKDLSPSERINTYNRLRAQALDISPGASKVYVELVPNGKVYPDWHEKAGENLPPDRLIIHENGEREMKYAEHEMLEREAAKAKHLETINKMNEPDLLPRFDPGVPGFDRVLHAKHLAGRKAEIDKEAAEAGKAAKSAKSRELADKTKENDQEYEAAVGEYETEKADYDEKKDDYKKWKKLVTGSGAMTDESKQQAEDAGQSVVELDGKFYLGTPGPRPPEPGPAPKKVSQSKYKMYDKDIQEQRAYDEAYKARREELRRTLNIDAKHRMEDYEGSASLGMPDVGNIASSGPSMAVNPDTGHQLTLEGDSWA